MKMKMKKGYYDVKISKCMGGDWRLYTIWSVYNKKDERLINELDEQLIRQGNFVKLVYNETMTRLMND